MASNEGPSRHHTTPELNYQTWDDFHSYTNSNTLFSIDILSADQSGFNLSPEMGAKSVTEPAELPERIRINSDCIIQILSDLHRPSSVGDGPIIMFRPYKTLVLFDQGIRRSVKELEGKTERRTPLNESLPRSPSVHESEVQLAQMKCLIQFMDIHLSVRVSFLHSPGCERIFFSDLWLLYKPGDTVVSRDLLQAYQVIRVENKRRIVEINGRMIVEDDSIAILCVCIDFDGQCLGPVLRNFAVKAWELSRNVEFLETVPLARAVAQKKTLKDDFIRRGQTFVKVARVSPMHYNGCTLDSQMQVNGTIIIDFQEALRDKKSFEAWRSSIECSLAEERIFTTGLDKDDNKGHINASKDDGPHDDSYVDCIRHQENIRSQFNIVESGSRTLSIAIRPRRLDQVGALREEELLIMNYRVFGYILDTGALESGKWGESFPDALKL